MTDQKPKIFLSYAHEDIGMAKRIYQDLKRYGLDVWFEKESLLAGQNIDFEIEKAIEESDYFLAVLSSKSIDKVGYIQKEVKTAIEKSKKYPKGKSYIIPVRLNDCKPRDKEIKELYWIDVFPENEYQNGLKKILQVVCKEALLLRSKSIDLSITDVSNIILKFDFFDNRRNSEGKGIEHNYKLKEINNDKVVFDKTTGLMWQQSGSDNEMEYYDAENWIKELNQNRFAGFTDWRLPTLEEAMSLMELESKNDVFIDPLFDSKQGWIWTSDAAKGEWLPESWTWAVDFYYGYCLDDTFDDFGCVRAVRSVQSS